MKVLTGAVVACVASVALFGQTSASVKQLPPGFVDGSKNPELIPDLAGVRGAPRRNEAIAVKALDAPAKPQAAREVTKLWAAFVLSGLGK